MGYFSMLQLELDEEEDLSYPSPEQQLLWRLDDLKDRLQFLNARGASYRSGYYLLDDDVRYALPEDLHCIYYVEKAIEMAKQDLWNHYEIAIPDEDELTAIEDQVTDEQDDYNDPNQITIFDVIVCGFIQQLKEAA